MEHIFLNLKRFDIPSSLGGVNSIAPPAKWAQYIIKSVKMSCRPCPEKQNLPFSSQKPI